MSNLITIFFLNFLVLKWNIKLKIMSPITFTISYFYILVPDSPKSTDEHETQV